MNAKKWIALILSLILCLGTLAGCQKQPAETTVPPAETTKPAKSTEPEPLKNSDIYPISSDHTFTIATTNANAETTINWNLMVDTVGIKAKWMILTQEQAPLLFVGDAQLPDMFMQTAGISIQQINEYGQAGKLVNYMDYWDLMPNLQAWYAAHPRLLDTVLDADGNFYALPGYSKHTTQAGNLFYIRTDMTKAAGIEELPTTIEGYLEMCETLKTFYADVDGYIPMVGNGPGSFTYNGAYAQFFFPAFGDLIEVDLGTNDAATEITAGFATEQFKHYISFMHELYVKGYLDSECFTRPAETGKAMLADQTTTINVAGGHLIPENFASGELDFQVYPVVTSQYQTQKRFKMPNNYHASQFMISAECPDIEAAIKFMDAFYAPIDNPLDEAGTVNCWSLEMGRLGVDYELNEEEGWYKFLDHEGYDSSTAWLHVAGTGYAIAREWDCYANDGSGQMVKGLGYRNYLLPHGVETFYISLLTLTQDEQDIYNDCWTDIQNYITEMNAAFITGQKNIATEWETYVSTLYNMGLQDVIDVYQAALDRYNAR